MKSLMKGLLFIASTLPVALSANGYTTIKTDLSAKNYTSQIEYQVLDASSPVKAFDVINKSLLKNISEGCDLSEAAESEYGQDYSAQATIIAANEDYVGFEIVSSSYCGGAHPNYYTYYMTFDALTGAEVTMDSEVPNQNYDIYGNTPNYWIERDAYQAELAEIIVKNIKPSDYKDLPGFADCYGEQELTRDELVQDITNLYPTIAGLTENKQVVVGISPPHVMAVCGFSIPVPYSDVQKYIQAGSILHTWLK